MSDDELTDEVAELRRDLVRAGIRTPPQPEEFDLSFRPASSFSDGVAPVVRLRRRGLAISALVAAAVTGLILVVTPWGRQHSEQPRFVTASQILDAAGAGESGLPGGNPSNARYLFVESIVRQGDDPPIHRRVWLGHFGDGLLDEGGSPAPIEKATFGLQRSQLSWDQVVALPSDAAELKQRLVEEAGRGPDAAWLVFKMAGELLSDTPTTLAVRKSLWTVLSSLSGVSAPGAAADGRGRQGLRVALSDPHRGTLTYLVDVDGGRLLEMRFEPLPQSGRDRYVVTYVARELTGSLVGQSP